MSFKLNLLGVEVDAITIDELNDEISKIIKKDQKQIIANHNLHSVYLIHKKPHLRNFWEKSYLTHIDGMSLIWWGKMLGFSLEREHRITYVDWIHPFLKIADNNKWSIFYLGSKPGVAQKAVDILTNSYTDIKFETKNGYFNADFNSEENKRIVKQINVFQPNILMVGMGMPRQEVWIKENFENLNANVILNCGACFDYIAGEQKTPPRFLGRLGFEWAHRLFFNPIRLFSRYFIEPLWLIPNFIHDIKNHPKKDN